MKKSMVTFLKHISPLIIAIVFFGTVSGVQSQEGIMEKAGKKIGEGVEAAKDTAVKPEEKTEAPKDTTVKPEEKTEAPKDTTVKPEEKTGMDKIKEGKSKVEEGMGKVKEGMDIGK